MGNRIFTGEEKGAAIKIKETIVNSHCFVRKPASNNFYEATPPSIPLTAENFCGRLLPSPRETVRPSQNTTTDAPTETVRTSQNTTTDAPTDHPKGKNLPIVPVVATCLTIAFVILVVAAVIWRCFVDKKKKEEDVALLDLGLYQ
ncbi:hypothetical protein P5673_010382 [Acropora cervicornis]|uniref:Uncharacterized protein n=1 Tax=Acropora cervicornis TaxID=6130 RepID=A0AAD9QRA7_ACRCE|nr:hypothetical protein P5673_010382 [Acropora cervicornis]